jgi:hypothetical protein
MTSTGGDADTLGQPSGNSRELESFIQKSSEKFLGLSALTALRNQGIKDDERHYAKLVYVSKPVWR